MAELTMKEPPELYASVAAGEEFVAAACAVVAGAVPDA